MKLFRCDHCGSLLYFNNIKCTHCSALLGFLPDTLHLAAFTTTDQPDIWQTKEATRWRQCANYRVHNACNWMVSSDSEQAFCLACRLNHTVPNLSNPTHYEFWRRLEAEKHHLVYSLLRFGLSVIPRNEDASGLAFDFLADDPTGFHEHGRILTGHAAGLITINIAEADPAIREKMRAEMAEPYRTILGHFRHESGHYYWDHLIMNSARHELFRDHFGDETLDYRLALQHHYQQGAPTDWQERFVSSYASSHPWEDWAETWAHYLHMVDTLDTAHQYGLQTSPRSRTDDELSTQPQFDPYQQADFVTLLAHWLPLTLAMNSLNRSMGHEDAYPFIISTLAAEKLQFVHDTIKT